MAGSDQIDLVNFAYSASIQTSASYNSITGVLSLNNGITTDSLNFVGGYTLANF